MNSFVRVYLLEATYALDSRYVYFTLPEQREKLKLGSFVLVPFGNGNRRLLAELVREHLPQAVLTPMEATYLGWLDLRAYGHDNETLMKLTHRAGVAFTGGTFFGQEAGDGFLRINIGCPARYVEEGILRLKVALETAE